MHNHKIRLIWCLVTLFAFALTLICSPRLSAANAAQSGTSTPTYVFPPPTYDPLDFAEKDIQDLEMGLDILRIDTSTCAPLCWKDFVPSETLMDNVIDWIGEEFGLQITSQGSIHGEDIRNAPNDSIGIGVGSVVTVGAFSDDSTPKTNLRAYYVHIRLTAGLEIANVSPRISDWLPIGIISRFGTPVSIYTHAENGYYTVLLEYANWLILYKGRLFADETAICPSQRVPNGIFFWMYAEQETSGLALLESLGGYENANGMQVFKPSEEGIRVTRDPAVINQIKDTLLETSCLPLALFESFQIEPTQPTQQPTPTPTPTAIPTSTSTPTPTDIPTSTPTHTPTTVPTFTPTATIPARFTPLRLRAVCSPFPALFRVWRVENDNRFALPFTWQVVDTRQDGHGVALARFDSYFFTATVRNNPNTVRILVRGVEQDVEPTTTAQCR